MGLSRDRVAEEQRIAEEFKKGQEKYNVTDDMIREALMPREFNNSVPHDPVNHPVHYNSSPAKCECGRRIECIDVTRHMGFNIGNAIKYLWRCDLKSASVEDLRKAAWYIADEIKERIK